MVDGPGHLPVTQLPPEHPLLVFLQYPLPIEVEHFLRTQHLMAAGSLGQPPLNVKPIKQLLGLVH